MVVHRDRFKIYTNSVSSIAGPIFVVIPSETDRGELQSEDFKNGRDMLQRELEVRRLVLIISLVKMYLIVAW